MHGWDGWHMGWMWIWWALGLAVVIAAVWLVARGGAQASGESAEQILKRRYASGDIDREEYERKLEDMRR